MRFMNTHDIADASFRYKDHPVLGPATDTLANLAQWTDEHSDGWAYWPKPARAAASLQKLITGDGARETADERATVEAYRAALVPIKAFRTRHGADFQIREA